MIELLRKLKTIGMAAVLREAFKNNKGDISRVQSKIYRGTPELTNDEASKIKTALDNAFERLGLWYRGTDEDKPPEDDL